MNVYTLAGTVFLALALYTAIATSGDWWLPLVWGAIGLICFVQARRA